MMWSAVCFSMSHLHTAMEAMKVAILELRKRGGPRWGQGLLRRGRVTKAYERKNCKFKGPLSPGLKK